MPGSFPVMAYAGRASTLLGTPPGPPLLCLQPSSGKMHNSKHFRSVGGSIGAGSVPCHPRDGVREAIQEDRMEVWLTLLVASFALGSFAMAEDGDAPDKQADRFKITTRRADDTVAVQADNDKVVFGVKSP